MSRGSVCGHRPSLGPPALMRKMHERRPLPSDIFAAATAPRHCKHLKGILKKRGGGGGVGGGGGAEVDDVPRLPVKAWLASEIRLLQATSGVTCVLFLGS